MESRIFPTVMFLVVAAVAHLLGQYNLRLRFRVYDGDRFPVIVVAVISWIICAASCVLAGLAFAGVVR